MSTKQEIKNAKADLREAMRHQLQNPDWAYGVRIRLLKARLQMLEEALKHSQ